MGLLRMILTMWGALSMMAGCCVWGGVVIGFHFQCGRMV